MRSETSDNKPIIETVRGSRAPLDLTAAVFRYRILLSGRIVVVPSHGRACWSAHPHHLRRR
jgi:hypothetical protein